MEKAVNLIASLNKKILLLVYDIAVIQLTSFVALWIRFEFNAAAIPELYIKNLFSYTLLVNTLLTLAVFYIFRLYHSMWMFAGSIELMNIGLACVLSGLGQFVEKNLLHVSMPMSFYVLYVGCLFVGVAGVRVCYRGTRWFKRALYHKVNADFKKVMLVGAGEAGSLIIKEITDSSHINGRVVCCIDDDPTKKGKYICGVKVSGDRECIPEAAKKLAIDEIIIAIPTLPPKSLSRILEYCKQTGCKIKILPGVYQFINEEVSISKLRDVEIEDLLGRDPIHVDLDEIMGYVTGKTVLVTGGGGSIGSELCRQIAGYKPKQLIIMDIYENNAYEIQQEILAKKPELDLVVLIASVRDEKRMDSIFQEYRPDIVYHAAAHKHVPLMAEMKHDQGKRSSAGTAMDIRSGTIK